MLPFNRCPVCGGEMQEKTVEKLVRGGLHTALLKVPAAVCLSCGERLYAQELVNHFEEVRAKLLADDFKGFYPLGQSFQVPPEALK